MRIDEFISGPAVDDLVGVLLLLDPTGAVLDANSAALERYGYSHDEMLALRLRDLTAVADEAPLPACESPAEHQLGAVFESVHRRSDGFEFPVEVRSAGATTHDGQTAVLYSVRDVTERRQAEKIAADARRRIESIIDGTNVGTWEWNVETGEMVLNDRWAQIFGYEVEQLAPTSVTTLENLLHPEDLVSARQKIDAHFAGESPYYDCECRMRHKDGHWVYVHDRGRLVSHTAEGEPLMMYGTCADISERRETEDALRESERTLSAIFESFPDGIVVTSVASGQIVEANEGFYRMADLTREQALGKTTSELLLWANADDRRRFRQEVALHGGVRDFETTFRRSGGEVISGTISSTLEQIGGELCSLVVVRDTSERKRSQDALRETEQRFETIFRGSPVGISLSRLDDGRVLDVNDAYLALFGLEREDVIGRDVGETATRVDADSRTRMLAELAERGSSSSSEVEFVTRAGQRKRLLEVAELIEIADEQYVLAFAQDIGDLVRAQGALREREAQYRAVVETSPDGFWVTDLEGRLLETNDAYAQRSGYSSEELLGMHIEDLEAQMSADDIVTHIAGVVAKGNEIFETEHRAKDGTAWPVEVSASYWPIGDGRLFVFMRDLARRRRAELLVNVRAQLAETEQVGDVDDLVNAAVHAAERLTGSQIGFFHFVDHSGEVHLRSRTWPQSAPAAMGAHGGGHGHGLDSVSWSDAVSSGQPIVQNRSDVLPGSPCQPNGHPKVQRELMVPVTRAGAVVALLGVGNKSEDYTEEDVETVGTIASMAADLGLRRKTQEEFEHFFELVPDMVCIISSEGYFHRLNPAWEHVLGYSNDELIGRSYLEYVHPDDREATAAHFEAQLHAEGAVAHTNRYCAKDGAYHWLEWNAAPVARDFSFAAARDITGRKLDEQRLLRYQTRLQSLAAELVVSAERERGRLGVELHDGLGQMLAAAKMSAQLLAAESLEPAGREQADRVVGLLGESISEVRSLTSQLAPTVLFELGLGSALLWLRDRYGQLYGLKVTMRVDDDVSRLRGELAVFLFRVVREALNNVVRHSQVLRATVTARRQHGCSSVSVSDSGVGFDPALIDEPGEVGGFGLFSIREECLTMGGTMDVASELGRGTRLKVRVPDDIDLVGACDEELDDNPPV